MLVGKELETLRNWRRKLSSSRANREDLESNCNFWWWLQDISGNPTWYHSTQRWSIWIRGSLCSVPLCKLCLCESSAKWKPCSHSLCICLPKEGPLWYINVAFEKEYHRNFQERWRGNSRKYFSAFFLL